MMTFRHHQSLASACVLATVVSALCAQTIPSTTSTSPAPKTIVVTASLEAFESADLYAKDPGYLSEVTADMGDHVKQGQILAVIDDPELQKQVEIAQAMLAARKESTKAAEASVEQSDKMLNVARSQRVSYEAELGLAQATLKRQEELFTNKAITNQQLDEVRAKAEVSRAQSEVAAARVAASQADSMVARANLSVARSQVTVADADLQRLQALGYNGFLIGETFMRAADPVAALRVLLGQT